MRGFLIFFLIVAVSHSLESATIRFDKEETDEDPEVDAVINNQSPASLNTQLTDFMNSSDYHNAASARVMLGEAEEYKELMAGYDQILEEAPSIKFRNDRNIEKAACIPCVVIGAAVLLGRVYKAGSAAKRQLQHRCQRTYTLYKRFQFSSSCSADLGTAFSADKLDGGSANTHQACQMMITGLEGMIAQLKLRKMYHTICDGAGVMDTGKPGKAGNHGGELQKLRTAIKNCKDKIRKAKERCLKQQKSSVEPPTVACL